MTVSWKVYLASIGILLVSAIVSIVLYGNAREDSGRVGERQHWLDSLRTARPDTVRIVYHDTIPGAHYEGNIAGRLTRENDALRDSIKSVILDNIRREKSCDKQMMLCEAAVETLLTPFTTELPLDSGSTYKVVAYPDNKSFWYDVQQKPFIRNGEIITVTKTVLAPPEDPSRWWLNISSVWHTSPGVGLEVGYGRIGMGRMVLAGEEPVTMVVLHWGL